MVGADTVQFVAGRVAPLGKFVVVVASANDPCSWGRRGGALGNGGNQLLDRADRFTLQRNLVQRRAVRLHVIVGVVEPRCDEVTIEVDRSTSFESRQLAARGDGHDPVANDPYRAGPRLCGVNSENIRVVENEVEAHPATLGNRSSDLSS